MGHRVSRNANVLNPEEISHRSEHSVSQPEGRQPTFATNLIDFQRLSRAGRPFLLLGQIWDRKQFFSAISGQSVPNNSPNFSVSSSRLPVIDVLVSII
jgi:hypothetical protein